MRTEYIHIHGSNKDFKHANQMNVLRTSKLFFKPKLDYSNINIQ